MVHPEFLGTLAGAPCNEFEIHPASYSYAHSGALLACGGFDALALGAVVLQHGPTEALYVCMYMYMSSCMLRGSTGHTPRPPPTRWPALQLAEALAEFNSMYYVLLDLPTD